jgi:hypothetical protein
MAIETMTSPDKKTAIWAMTILVVGGLLMQVACQSDAGQDRVGRAKLDRAQRGAARPGEVTLSQIPFDGQRAFDMLKTICEIGPRVSGTAGMTRQQEILTEHFEALGGQVRMQPFSVRHPETGDAVEMANMIVHWHPDRKRRVLLCAHYDTRPFPDRDRDAAKRRDPFIGANDGASGVALLAELGQHMADFESKYGVDFVLFDGEELVYDDERDEYFLGSTHFAKDYRKSPPSYKYKYGVLFDMVADRDLNLYHERHSVGWRDTRVLVFGIWRTAQRLGVKEFINNAKYEVRDDHLPLHDVAGIPTCDIIDFDYGPSRLNSYWHTTHDTPDKCSALSLAKVGWVTLSWLQGLK